MAQLSTCLYTTVRNIAGETRTFSFLPPHGKTLTHLEEYSFLGEPVGAISRGDRVSSTRYIDGFEDAIEADDMDIIQTPVPILKDMTTNVSKRLKLAGGTLSTIDPCWSSTAP